MSSTAEPPYRDGVALWAGATDRARTEAVARGANSGALLRQFVSDRFLARVFHVPNAPWVLKGGTAVLARVADARTTKDVDLLGELDDIDVALGRLRSAAAVDLGDHFRFIITGHDPGTEPARPCPTDSAPVPGGRPRGRQALRDPVHLRRGQRPPFQPGP